MKKSLLLLLTLAVLLTACAAPAQKSTLKLAVLPVLDVFPVYVAQQQGYFEKFGVTVEIIKVASAPERDQLMQAGQIDGMLNEPVTTMFYNKQQSRIKMVRYARTATSQQALFRILAAKDSGIKTVADLKGKQIGISTGTVIEYLTDRLLAQNGLDPSQVEKVAVPKIDERLALLGSGKLAAAVMPDPLASLSIQNGATVVIDDSSAPELSASVYSFSIDALKNKPQAVKAFLKAIEQAVQDINADKGKWNGLLTEQKLVPAPLLSSYTLPDFPTAGVPSEAQFNDAMQWALDKGLIPNKINYADSVDSSYLPK